MKNIFHVSLPLLFFFLNSCSSSHNFNSVEFEHSIMTINQWGGTPAVDSLAHKHIITSITLHHGGEPFPKNKNVIQYLRTLQQWSRSEKKWIDIPYHYIIDLEGNIYEGRSIAYAGDTNTKYDPTGHALVCVVGNYEESEPTPAQLQSVVNTFTWLCQKYTLSPSTIKGHKDVADSTVCPGKNLYQYLQNGYFQKEVSAKLQKRQ